MNRFALIFLAFGTFAASAATPEDAYIETRDKSIAALKRMQKAKTPQETLNKKNDADLADLDRQMQAIIGAVRIKGFPSQGKLTIDTLFSDDQGFGLLDGLVFTVGEDEHASVVVTNENLLARWLKEHRNDWPKIKNVQQQPVEALKTDEFFSQAVATDAALIHYGDLPVTASNGARFVRSTLVAYTQDKIPEVPDTVTATVWREGRIYAFRVKLDVPFQPSEKCNALERSYEARVAKAAEAERAAKKPDSKALDSYNKLSAERDEVFRKCYAEVAVKAPQFRNAAEQAQKLIDSIDEK